MGENNDIPIGWHEIELNSLINEMSDGGTPSRNVEKYFGGDIPWVVIDDIKDEIYSTREYLTEFGFNACSSKLWDVGTIILSTGATIGNVGLLKIKSATKQGICGIDFKKTVNNKYMMYLLKTMKNQLLSNSQGSTIREIRPSLIKKFIIKVPQNKCEQDKIVEILSKIDSAILQTEEIIAKYNRIKTGLIQDLLSKGIDENGNIRSEETHEFKDSQLGRIPKEWDCLELRKCIELHNNKRKPISSLVRAKMIGEFPYYGATGIIDNLNIYNVEGEFVLFGEDGDHFLKWKKQEQTILVDGKFNVSNHAHIVKGNHLCSTKWLHYFYFHRDITFYLTRQGAGRFKLNKESLLSLPILVPQDMNEQIKIIDKIEYLNNFINLHKIQNEKLHVTKTGLMHDLLSGKKRVTHLIN